MTVEPIRDKKKIRQMYTYLNGNNPKYGLLFKFGLNTGLRISDILPIKANDIFNTNWCFKNHLILKEKKTGKEKKIKLNNALRICIQSYVKNQKLSLDNYLFHSQKGGHKLTVF